MFDTLLIANRGEIACRIIRSARALGLRTVAVHSSADREALHVALADRAVEIGPPAPAESYLNAARIIRAAQATGAQAIHPGYGFLSENPEFVEAVQAAGLVFVGPPAQAIRAMGLKDAAKALMQAAGVPVVPGWQGESQEIADLAEAAAGLGYPVLIKAVAGGGGKGMRRVDDPADFAEALARAQAEARAAFANPRVLIEKFIDTPRHIEIQVFADTQGQVIHLGERDCSLQRRHQKVIEEAPAPGMTDALRAAMGAAAVRAAQAIGYVGAGTVEFIAEGGALRPGGFWFMEMNTRLQVEHPVTEAVTGLDLVEWQLRIARGEPLPLRQEDLRLTGHAVEARLYAEDAEAGFLPATGRIAHLAFAPGLRVDTGVRAGDVITPHYDPMIAKMIAHGPDRATALARLARGLEATEIAGTVTNIGFLARLVQHPDVCAGRVDTGLIAREMAVLTGPAVPSQAAIARAAVAAAGLDRGLPWQGGFALWAPIEQPVTLLYRGETLALLLRVTGPGRVDIGQGGTWTPLHLGAAGWQVPGGPALACHRDGARITVQERGPLVFDLPDPLARAGAAGPGGDVVLAPMPGLVRQVLVGVGATVTRGERLAVLEAMKMEQALPAPRDGRIAEVLIAPGQQVESGTALIRLEPEA